MRLTSLELTNVCQHEHLKWEFERGLIGIYGSNGSGKTNAMNVGCYGGFTNDFSRHVSGKPGVVRQQKPDHETSEIRNTFEQNGHSYTISRKLTKPARHEMLLPSGKVITGAKEIADTLEQMLGIKRQLIDDFMFVDQWHLFSFLNTTPAERAKSFAYLCNTREAEEIWVMLGDQIAADMPLAVTTLDNRDELRQELGRYRSRRAEAVSERTAARQNLLTKARKEECDSIVANRNRWQVLDDERSTLQEEEPVLKQAAVTANKARKPVQDSVDSVQEEVDQLSDRYDMIVSEVATLRSRQEQAEQYQALEQDRVNAQEAVTDMEGRLVGLIDPGYVISELEDENAAMVNRLRREQDVLRLRDEGNCPTCKRPYEVSSEAVLEAERAIPPLKILIEEAKQNIAAQRQYVADQASAKKDVQIAEKCLAGVVRLLAQREPVLPISDGELAALRQEKQEIEQKREHLNDLKNQAAQASQAFAVARANHQSCQRRIESISQTMAGCEEDDDRHLAAVTDLDRHRVANTAMKAAQAKITELDKFIDSCQKTLRKVTRQLERSKNARRMLDDFQEARDEVFHRDKLPQRVHASYLKSMEDAVNDELSMFDSPFRITALQDISFEAYFTDGTVVPAAGLSGGQKVMLAMAYRLTLNSLFGDEVGMMVLDEPTDGLDSDNKALAAEVFRRAGSIAKSRGHQIIVITHDASLETVFDQKFVLERTA